MISRECKFKIGEKSFTVKFPNVGQIIDIESLKQALTNNRYGVMAASGVTSMYYALDIVDAISFYQAVAPSVSKYYDIKSYTSLAPEDMKDLTEAYTSTIKPWYDKVMSELKGVTNVENEDTDASE